MLKARVLPCLLLKNRGLVKTTGFRDPVYVGDPINAVRIFNEKEVDELVFLDITATVERKEPPLQVIAEIAGECFMPLCYGGGIRSTEQIREILGLGVEKVAINSAAAQDPSLISRAAREFGSQSIVVSMDVRKSLLGKRQVATFGATKSLGIDPVSYAQRMEAAGAGELMVTSIERDGTMKGYDLDLVRAVVDAVSIPVIACGGAGSVADLAAVVGEAGASGAAAGAMFVFHGKHRAVLISYPSRAEIEAALGEA